MRSLYKISHSWQILISIIVSHTQYNSTWTIGMIMAFKKVNLHGRIYMRWTIMPKDKLTHLGTCIRTARHAYKLTLQELADQFHMTIKTIQNIGKWTMVLSLEMLYSIVNRLGISAHIPFNPLSSDKEEEIHLFIGLLQTCTPRQRKFLLSILICIAEQLSTFWFCAN